MTKTKTTLKKKDKTKKKYYSTSFWVVGYVVSYMLLTLLYCLPRMLAEFSNFDLSHVNEAFTFPLEIFAWGLFVICAGYCGLDRAAFVKKSSKLDIGKCDIGDVGKLRRIIFYLTIVFAEDLIINFFLGHPTIIISDYGKQVFQGINLPIDGISYALVSTILCYAVGNKSIRFAQNVEGTKEDISEDITVEEVPHHKRREPKEELPKEEIALQ